jgi:hypothetical protein
MKITKHLLLFALLAMTGLSARAVNVSYDIGLIGSPSTSLSAGLSDPSGTAVNHTVSGYFTDTFNFSFSGQATIDVWLNTSVNLGNLSTQQIVFTSATLNDQALTIKPDRILGGTRFSSAGLYEAPATGDFKLVVNGYAGSLDNPGQQISASYSGGINVVAAAVPEPDGYALMLAGLGVVAFIVRRRSAR